MNKTILVTIVLATGVAGAGAGYWYATRWAAHDAARADAASVTESGRRVLYWYDPMVPQSRFDKPGKSPFMDMQLVPKYADEAAGEGTVAIDSRTLQNLGVRTAEARPGALELKLTAVGNVEYNERSVVLVQPRAAGW
jgi:Cu(I)/Ag(I) efflux system membrane fusion protein